MESRDIEISSDIGQIAGELQKFIDERDANRNYLFGVGLKKKQINGCAEKLVSVFAFKMKVVGTIEDVLADKATLIPDTMWKWKIRREIFSYIEKISSLFETGQEYTYTDIYDISKQYVVLLEQIEKQFLEFENMPSEECEKLPVIYVHNKLKQLAISYKNIKDNHAKFCLASRVDHLRSELEKIEKKVLSLTKKLQK